tara:strand:+ start:5719 stop:5874 length:156 start_codon:yes stop_codon:yes gene_type:complete
MVIFIGKIKITKYKMAGIYMPIVLPILSYLLKNQILKMDACMFQIKIIPKF